MPAQSDGATQWIELVNVSQDLFSPMDLRPSAAGGVRSGAPRLAGERAGPLHVDVGGWADRGTASGDPIPSPPPRPRCRRGYLVVYFDGRESANEYDFSDVGGHLHSPAAVRNILGPTDELSLFDGSTQPPPT